MNAEPNHMRRVQDYFLFIDERGNVWKLKPTYWLACPFEISLVSRA